MVMGSNRYSCGRNSPLSENPDSFLLLHLQPAALVAIGFLLQLLDAVHLQIPQLFDKPLT